MLVRVQNVLVFNIEQRQCSVRMQGTNCSSHVAPVPELDSPNRKTGVGKHTAVCFSPRALSALGDSHSSEINALKKALQPRQRFSSSLHQHVKQGLHPSAKPTLTHCWVRVWVLRECQHQQWAQAGPSNLWQLSMEVPLQVMVASEYKAVEISGGPTAVTWNYPQFCTPKGRLKLACYRQSTCRMPSYMHF